MKFGIRECANIVFRAKQETLIGTETFHAGQPVLYIDTATTSTLEQGSTTVYAQGGRGNTRLIAWEGDKTLTFTVTDALLSPIGFSVLSGAGLFKDGATAGGKVHFHMSTAATMSVANNVGTIDLTDAIAEFGSTDSTYNAGICLDDAPIYIMITEGDGSITGQLIEGALSLDSTKAIITVTPASGSTVTASNVMVDYYVDLPGTQVYEADITADTFSGYYYVEADTLFRDQSTGKDMPANLTFPNVKIQSNFTMTFAGTGDPSTFAFTMDAFPGYTYFDKSKKVLCVLQVAADAALAAAGRGKPVMPHTGVLEHNAADDILDLSEDSATNFPQA